MLEAGVTGVPRDRAWDVIATAALPELRGSALTRISFYVFAPGEVEVVGFDGGSGVTDDVVVLMAEHAAASLAPPIEARAVRTGDEQWSIAVRKTNRRSVQLSLPDGISLVSVARAPDGELTAHVNGELVIDPAGDVEVAIARVIEAAEHEEDAFVATAERYPSGRVALSIDPL